MVYIIHQLCRSTYIVPNPDKVVPEDVDGYWAVELNPVITAEFKAA